MGRFLSLVFETGGLMKKFSFGLILGLLIGFLGVLAYFEAVKPERVDLSEAQISRPEVNGPGDREAELAAARVRLQSILASRKDTQSLEVLLNTLDGALFDKDWSLATAVAEALHALSSELPSGAAPSSSDQSPARSVSLGAERLELERRLFFSQMLQYADPATEAVSNRDPDERLHLLSKILSSSAVTVAEKRLRRHAAFALALSCGETGLQVLTGLITESTDPEDFRLAVEAIARSDERQAPAIVLRIGLDERRSLEEARHALRCLSLNTNFTSGRSSGIQELAATIGGSRTIELREAAIQAVGRVDFTADPALEKALLPLIAPAESEPLRLAALAAIAEQARVYLRVPAALIAALEANLEAESNDLALKTSLKVLELAGREESIDALTELTLAARFARLRPEARAALLELNRRFGRD